VTLAIGRFRSAAALLLNAVVLALIRAAQIAVIALQHGISGGIRLKRLAGDGIAPAVVADDLESAHRS
jgi:hypothetical protein